MPAALFIGYPAVLLWDCSPLWHPQTKILYVLHRYARFKPPHWVCVCQETQPGIAHPPDSGLHQPPVVWCSRIVLQKNACSCFFPIIPFFRCSAESSAVGSKAGWGCRTYFWRLLDQRMRDVEEHRSALWVYYLRREREEDRTLREEVRWVIAGNGEKCGQQRDACRKRRLFLVNRHSLHSTLKWNILCRWWCVVRRHRLALWVWYTWQ